MSVPETSAKHLMNQYMEEHFALIWQQFSEWSGYKDRLQINRLQRITFWSQPSSKWLPQLSTLQKHKAIMTQQILYMLRSNLEW